MKTILFVLSLSLGLFYATDRLAQTQGPTEKLSVTDRMAKARAAKAEKREQQLTDKPQKASPADYKTPVDNVLKGPHGEVVHQGERGGKYYINKNGNKTYLSSNQ